MDNATCPNIFELLDGHFAVVGTDRTAELKASLPPDAGCGPHERIVIVPRATMIGAKPYIPEE